MIICVICVFVVDVCKKSVLVLFFLVFFFLKLFSFFGQFNWCLREEELVVKNKGDCYLREHICSSVWLYSNSLFLTPSLLSERCQWRIISSNGSVCNRAIINSYRVTFFDIPFLLDEMFTNFQFSHLKICIDFRISWAPGILFNMDLS